MSGSCSYQGRSKHNQKNTSKYFDDMVLWILLNGDEIGSIPIMMDNFNSVYPQGEDSVIPHCHCEGASASLAGGAIFIIGLKLPSRFKGK